MVSTISISFFILGMATGLLGAAISEYDILFLAYHLVFISNILYTFQNIKKNCVFLVFNLLFFVFIMGRTSMNYLFYGDYGISYANYIVSETFTIILVALLSIRVFYCLEWKNFALNYRRISIFALSRLDNSILRKVCLYLYWASYIFAFVYILERVLFVQVAGYAAYYTSFSTQLPSIFPKLYTFNEIVFFIFLATNPSKEVAMKPVISFILLGVFSLGYGQRNPVALRYCIIFLIYYPIRELFKEPDEISWVTDLYKKIVLVSIPAAVVFFAIWGSYRSGGNFDLSIGDAIVQFFDTQGNSTLIVAETLKNYSYFPEGKIYTFCPIVEFMTNNIVYKFITGGTSYVSGFTVESAINGWNLGNTLSYLYSPFHFLQGVGLGSCYLAEVFKDFGYIGIIIISAIYARIMALLIKSYGKNVISTALLLLFTYRLIYAPRDLALGFIADIFSFTGIASIVVVYLLYTFNSPRTR